MPSARQIQTKAKAVTTMAVVDPLPKNPTNEDLAKGIGQLHNCLEEHRNQSSSNFKVLDAKVGGLEVNQNTLLTAFKLAHDNGQVNVKGSKPLALMTQSEAIIKFGAAIGAVLTLYKVGFVAWPFIMQFFKAVLAIH